MPKISKKRLKRREFLWGLSQSTLAVLIFGRASHLVVASESESVLAQVSADTSNSFTQDEFNIIDSIINIILPTDNNPGARETGITEYMVQLFQNRGSEAVSTTKAALGQIDEQALKLFSVNYNTLNSNQQEQIVALVASEPNFRPFWRQLRNPAVLRFYSLPEGYQPVGQPGPNIDRGGFPALGC